MVSIRWPFGQAGRRGAPEVKENGDVVQAGAFADSLARTEADVGLSLTSTSPAPLRLAILMLVLRAYERGDPDMAVEPVEAWIAPYRVVRL